MYSNIQIAWNPYFLALGENRLKICSLTQLHPFKLKITASTLEQTETWNYQIL